MEFLKSQSIVDDFGGLITGENMLGIGTTLKVLFPNTKQSINKPGLQEAGAKKDMTQTPQQRCILVVDDEIALTGFLSELLESQGYEVKVVNNASDALKLFRKNPLDIDLVLTDQTMPGITGAEMAAEMLNMKPGLPVILTTGYSELIDEAGAKELGIRAYLSKPMETQHLLGVIKELLTES